MIEKKNKNQNDQEILWGNAFWAKYFCNCFCDCQNCRDNWIFLMKNERDKQALQLYSKLVLVTNVFYFME